ncbi:MAG: aminotransferase class I/II-fold pyridoxal phosphate-dependent enzyme [Clostridiales bacterium]|nr:aminotransferase class I/II-fold pyridoxal phosphate-dependent enzyme [Clostridiales bacterium]
MPGHKRKKQNIFENVWDFDITEIAGYDNLHHPEGIIRDSMNGLKKIYQTKESWYLVNGSTTGILASISSCCGPGDAILVSRNCHKSVYNAIRLFHLQAYYFSCSISEKYDIVQGIQAEQEEEIKSVLQSHDNIKAIILPSPTYEGVIMDIGKIKSITEEYDVKLIVDEAHGAHLMFHEYFPKSAVKCGADLVVQSTHKTLPALTQTALLHLCSNRVSAQKISDRLSILESSSPSYILMASAEYAVQYMDENVDIVEKYVDNLKEFRSECRRLRHLHLIEKEDLMCKDYDNSKLVFSVKDTNINGIELFQLLFQKNHIEFEMADRSNCVGMTSVSDRKEDYDILFHALKKIDDTLCGEYSDFKSRTDIKNYMEYIPEKILESWECSEFMKIECNLEEAEGKISGDYVMLYPPGIPLLVPGEKIVKEIVENIRYYIYNGYNVYGLSGEKIIVLEL